MNQLVLGTALTAALEMLGHWFPWPRRLHRIAAYLYGTLAILIGIAVATERRTLLRTFAVCAGAGIATMTAYIIDIHLQARQVRRIHGRHA